MKERNSPEGSDTELLSNGHHVIVLSDGTALGGNLGVSAALTPAQKWAFLATNIPYALVAAQIFAAPRIREDAILEPLADGCASPLFHGAIVAGLCVVSTVWHAAQCQVASLLFGAAPFLPPVLKSLLVGDVLCSLMAVIVGLFCFRGRTAAWLALPFCPFCTRGAASASRIFRGTHSGIRPGIACRPLRSGTSCCGRWACSST